MMGSMKRNAYVLVVVAACGNHAAAPPATPAHPASQGGACWGNQLVVEPSAGVRFKVIEIEAAKTWAPPPELAIDVAVRSVDATSITMEALVTNAGTAPIAMVTLSGGIIGYSTNPFDVRLDLPMRPHPSVRGIEQYPEPEQASLPPGAKVRYVVSICTEQYAKHPRQTAHVAWSFELWSHRRSGVVDVTMQ